MRSIEHKWFELEKDEPHYPMNDENFIKILRVSTVRFVTNKALYTKEFKYKSLFKGERGET